MNDSLVHFLDYVRILNCLCKKFLGLNFKAPSRNPTIFLLHLWNFTKKKIKSPGPKPCVQIQQIFACSWRKLWLFCSRTRLRSGRLSPRWWRQGFENRIQIAPGKKCFQISGTTSLDRSTFDQSTFGRGRLWLGSDFRSIRVHSIDFDFYKLL